MTSRRRFPGALLATALVALPLACGDDDDGGLGSGGGTTEAAPGDTEVGGTEPAATEPPDTEPADTEPDGTGDEPSGGDLDRWCALTAELNQIDPLGDEESASPEEVEATFNEMNDLADQYLDAAPDDIRSDAQVVVDAFHGAQELLAEHDYDISAVTEDPAFEDVFNADVEAAGDRLDEFEEANC